MRTYLEGEPSPEDGPELQKKGRKKKKKHFQRYPAEEGGTSRTLRGPVGPASASPQRGSDVISGLHWDLHAKGGDSDSGHYHIHYSEPSPKLDLPFKYWSEHSSRMTPASGLYRGSPGFPGLRAGTLFSKSQLA